MPAKHGAKRRFPQLVRSGKHTRVRHFTLIVHGNVEQHITFDLLLDRMEAEKKTGKITVTRFKGLGEMNPSQLRETTMAKETRRLVQLTVDGNTMGEAREVLDKLLAKKRASDRRDWLQDKGNLADLGVDSAG